MYSEVWNHKLQDCLQNIWISWDFEEQSIFPKFVNKQTLEPNEPLFRKITHSVAGKIVISRIYCIARRNLQRQVDIKQQPRGAHASLYATLKFWSKIQSCMQASKYVLEVCTAQFQSGYTITV